MSPKRQKTDWVIINIYVLLKTYEVIIVLPWHSLTLGRSTAEAVTLHVRYKTFYATNAQ